MSARTANVFEIVLRYAAGYFPLYDLEDHFYWERLPIRAIIPVSREAAQEARRIGRRARKKFIVRHTAAVDQVIGHLQDRRVKPDTWVRSEVAAIYRVLDGAGLLQTIEAYDAATGQLAGALLGLVLPGTFIAETMFSLRADASKVCLCELVENALAAGHLMIDVQTPHHLEPSRARRSRTANKTQHPCMRLGEQTVPLDVFLRLLRKGAGCFPGSLTDWVRIAGEIAGGREGHVELRQLAVARPMLMHNVAADRPTAIDG